MNRSLIRSMIYLDLVMIGARPAIGAHEATIDDLRRRLDVATQQLGEALQQVRILTDQRTPRGWWRRLLDR